LDKFCSDNHLPVLLRIAFERVIAEGVAQGKTLVEIHPEYADRFLRLFTQISAMS
jgi:MinD superfamily P-loop ATPase